MKTKITFFLMLMVTVAPAVFFFADQASAGQVVTEETREWARNALDREKKLDTVSTPDTIAVLYFNNSTKDAQFDLLRKGLSLMLTTDLSKVESVKVVERIKLQALVDEMGLQSTDLTREETDVRMGRLMGAEFLVGGDILKKDDTSFLLSSNMLNVPRNKISGKPEADGKLLDDLFDMEKQLLFKIISLLKIELTEKQKQELKKPMTKDPQAFMYFVQGVDESDKGNYEKAESFYKKAVERDPELTPAKDASREILELGILKPKIDRRQLLKIQKTRVSLTDMLTPVYPNKRFRLPQNMTQTCEVQIDWDTIPQN